MNKQVRYEFIKRNIGWSTTLGELAGHLKFDFFDEFYKKAFLDQSPKLINYKYVTIGSLFISYEERIGDAFLSVVNNLDETQFFPRKFSSDGSRVIIERYTAADISDYQNRISEDQQIELLESCNTNKIPPVICAWYDDNNDFLKDWCNPNDLNFSEEEATERLLDGIESGEFVRFKSGEIVRLVI